MTNNKSNKFFWLFPYAIVAFGLLFSYIGLSEFYNIKIAGQESAYSFGPINENPWYYENASVYSGYNLISGLMFLVTSVLTGWATIKKNKTLVIWGISLIVFFFVGEIITAKVQ